MKKQLVSHCFLSVFLTAVIQSLFSSLVRTKTNAPQSAFMMILLISIAGIMLNLK